MTNNTIISIGWTGFRTCYLNVPMEDAVKRWMEAEGEETPPSKDMISTITVGDEWHSYDGAWT